MAGLKPYLERELLSHPLVRRVIPYKKEFSIYIVGGTIRDFLLGKNPVDLDIVVEGDGKAFAEKLGKVIPLKKELDEWRVVFKDGFIDVLGIDVPIEEDLKRRDFTINSLAYHLNTGRFFDPMNGIKDLENNTLRANSEASIISDPIRILRGLRISSELGLGIEDETMRLFRVHAQKIRNSAGERIHQELVLFFSKDNTGDYIVSEVFDAVFPGFMEMEKIGGGRNTSINLLEHSILSLKFLEKCIQEKSPFEGFWKKIDEYIRNKGYLLKIFTLLHDIKKPETFSEDENGHVHFYGHDELGAQWFYDVGKSLRFSKKEIEYVSRMIKNHMWLHLLSSQPEITERAKRRMIFKLGEDVMGLAIFSYADSMASGGVEVERVVKVGEEVLSYYFTSKREIKRILYGRDIIKEFGLEPGPFIGHLLARVQSAYEDGYVKTKEEAIEYVRKILVEEGIIRGGMKDA